MYSPNIKETAVILIVFVYYTLSIVNKPSAHEGYLVPVSHILQRNFGNKENKAQRKQNTKSTAK